MTTASDWVSPPSAQRFIEHLRDIPDFPQPGVIFKDITGLLGSGAVFNELVVTIAQRLRSQYGQIDAVAGLEARGFLIASAVAHELGAGLLPIRKAGKLPPPVLSHSYDLEYGSATIEIRDGILEPGTRTVILDDVLATGGTARAGVDILREAGAQVLNVLILLELEFLDGRTKLADVDVDTVLRVS